MSRDDVCFPVSFKKFSSHEARLTVTSCHTLNMVDSGPNPGDTEPPHPSR